MHGEDDPLAAAMAYESVIDEIVGDRFDLIQLGMGSDGHIASLFPGTPALHERSRRVAAQFVPAAGMWRITLTPVEIGRANAVTVIVSGESKSAAVANALEGRLEPDQVPAQLLRSAAGSVLWLLDSSAASGLREQKKGG
jgi:6-phosphogluconolactonase